MRTIVTVLFAAIGAAIGLPPATASQTAGDLEVTVAYTGKGPVDDTHEIWVFLFTSPVINSASQPVAVQAVRKNGASASFKGVSHETVYVALAYDEKGTYDGNAGPPPPGTPIGMYGKDGKDPDPVKPGKGTKIKASFNDARRMGQPSQQE